MRLILISLLSILTVNTGVAQGTVVDRSITIRLTPAGSFIDSVLVNYAGIWSHGFELNEFTPCGGWLPDSLGGAAIVPNRIGMTNGYQVWYHMIQAYPDSLSFFANRPKDSTSDLFIMASGWLIGPGAYDHFGTNLYTIKTIRFDEVRWAIPNECHEKP